MLTRKQQAYIEERAKDRTASNAEIARRAGYSVKRAGVTAFELERRPEIQAKIAEYGEIGLDTLKDVAQNGRNEIARSASGKTLAELAYGRPKSNDEKYSKVPEVNLVFLNSPK